MRQLRYALLGLLALAGLVVVAGEGQQAYAGTYTLTIAGARENAAATDDLDITDALIISGVSAATTPSPAGLAHPPSAGGQDVVIFLRDARPLQPAASLDRQALRSSVAETQDRVLSAVEASGFQVRYRYSVLPTLAGTISPRGLERLAAHPDVLSIVPDFRGQGALGESVALIGADDVHGLGFTGAGTVVAVIDSGVDTYHPDLADDLTHEECFMAASFLSSRCPDGSVRQSGPGAAEDDLGHGTNVAGIITGKGTVAPLGVAPDAQIEAFKIIDSNNTLGFSDLNAALDHIANSHPEVDFINMSLGSFFAYPPGTCEWSAFIYDLLRDTGILSFAASMNEGAKSGMGLPACVESVVSVGAVYDANLGAFATTVCTDSPASVDKVACWSNSDTSLDLLGPGCIIIAAGLSGGSSMYCGTSQATPHALAVAALLQGADPSLTPDRIEWMLKSAGVSITDPANGVTTPRVDALAAFSLDSDGDGFPDVGDNCPAWPNADQSVPAWPVPEADPDCDGFATTNEGFMGTLPLVHCAATNTANDEGPQDAWPPDADDDQDADVGDVLALFYGKIFNPSAYSPRSDFDGSGDIDVGDVLGLFYGKVFTSCA